jgi:histone-lysine N-methyltransferase SETMAR
MLIDWLPQGATVNSNTYCDLVTHLHRRIQQRRKGKWAKKVFLLLDNAHPHSSKQTRAQLDELGYMVFPHPLYSPDLAHSDYALFDKMKKPLRGRCPTHQWCRTTPKDWFQEAVLKLP